MKNICDFLHPSCFFNTQSLVFVIEILLEMNYNWNAITLSDGPLEK